MQNLPSPALSQHIHFSAEPLSLAPGGRLRRKIRVGRERGHCVCWPCSKIPALGWEQPLGWLKKLSAGTKPPPRAWLVPTAPASWGRGESVPCLEHPHTSRGSAPNFRAPQPCHGQWEPCCAGFLAAVGQEQPSWQLPCPHHRMLCERRAASCSQETEGEGGRAMPGDLTTKEDTTAPQALLFFKKRSPGAMQGDCFKW